MKKNFLKVAALLIAAMLMVVSCSQEVVPKNEDNKDPVEVMLNTSVASKGLSFDGLDSVEDVTYTYELDALWNDGNLDEKIVGETTSPKTLDSIEEEISLGYLSQGYWKITVVGTHRNGKVVLKGETTKYITSSDKTFTVFLKNFGDSSSSTTLTFNIDVNDLAANNGGYKLKYNIDGADYAGNSPSDSIKTGTIDERTTAGSYVSKYEGSVSGLKPGYYRVTVSLVDGENNTVGSITRGLLIINGDEAITIKGSVTASDFAKSSLVVLNPKVEISSITAKVGENGQDIFTETINGLKKGSYTITDAKADSVEIIYTVTSSVSGITKEQMTQYGITNKGTTYTWIDDKTGETLGTSATYKPTYAPGNRYVTCIVTTTYEYNNGSSTAQYPISAEAYTYIQIKK